MHGGESSTGQRNPPPGSHAAERRRRRTRRLGDLPAEFLHQGADGGRLGLFHHPAC